MPRGSEQRAHFPPPPPQGGQVGGGGGRGGLFSQLVSYLTVLDDWLAGWRGE